MSKHRAGPPLVPLKRLSNMEGNSACCISLLLLKNNNQNENAKQKLFFHNLFSQ